MRTAKTVRKTNETDIIINLNIDGTGVYKNDTGCGFLNHMLDLFAKHGQFDLNINCKGDVYVDYHHTTEDVGIALGEAFLTALGDKTGIKRYGDVIIPMDETLVLCAVDFSGRCCVIDKLDIPSEKVGDFDTELVDEFFAGFSRSSKITLHIKKIYGTNSHHIIEAAFKAFARAIKNAVTIDDRLKNQIPSTKGVL